MFPYGSPLLWSWGNFDGVHYIRIVEDGYIGKAIGKHGSNVKRIENILKKKIRIIEFNSSVIRFITNIIYPIKVKEITEDKGIVTITGFDKSSKSTLIGRDKKNLLSITSIVKRFFPVEEIKVI